MHEMRGGFKWVRGTATGGDTHCRGRRRPTSLPVRNPPSPRLLGPSRQEASRAAIFETRTARFYFRASTERGGGAWNAHGLRRPRDEGSGTAWQRQPVCVVVGVRTARRLISFAAGRSSWGPCMRQRSRGIVPCLPPSSRSTAWPARPRARRQPGLQPRIRPCS